MRHLQLACQPRPGRNYSRGVSLSSAHGHRHSSRGQFLSHLPSPRDFGTNTSVLSAVLSIHANQAPARLAGGLSQRLVSTLWLRSRGARMTANAPVTAKCERIVILWICLSLFLLRVVGQVEVWLVAP